MTQTHPPADLRPLGPDPWGELAVPRGWRGVARLARRVAVDLEPLTARIVACVVDEIPAYRDGPVPEADLARSIERNIEVILLGLAENRGPTREEIDVRRELGRRRALQGVAVESLIQAYHVGYRELWLAIVEELDETDTATATRLLTAATTVWRWVHDVTDAIATAHAATVRHLEARAIGARQRFVELLIGGDLDGEEVDRLARSLGFHLAAPFVAVISGGARTELDAVELQRETDALEGRHAVVARGPLVIVISQGGDPDEVVDAAHRVVPTAAVAVGSARPGLRGARASLTDAELTLAVLDDAETGSFDDAWLWATLAGAGERLRPLLARGAEVAAGHRHLAEAVLAFAETEFSVSEAARRLSLHPNTVAYRLERWAELTGWDPRSFPGLARSLAALRLAP